MLLLDLFLFLLSFSSSACSGCCCSRLLSYRYLRYAFFPCTAPYNLHIYLFDHTRLSAPFSPFNMGRPRGRLPFFCPCCCIFPFLQHTDRLQCALFLPENLILLLNKTLRLLLPLLMLLERKSQPHQLLTLPVIADMEVVSFASCAEQV